MCTLHTRLLLANSLTPWGRDHEKWGIEMLSNAMTNDNDRNDAIRDHQQRIADMTTLEVRCGVGQPWQRVRDVYPGITKLVGPTSDGIPDERVLIASGLRAGALEFVPEIDPLCPLAFRLSGQYRARGGWQLTPRGARQLLMVAERDG